MSSVGISNYLANGWLGTLDNVPFVVGLTCVQLHIGIPGANGTSNPSAVTARKAATFTTPSGATIALASTSPQWSATAGEQIQYISVWSGFDGDGDAKFLWSALLTPPKTVANGDVVNLNSCNLTIVTVAA